MSYLLDSDICSNYLRSPKRLFTRFLQHSGQLHISSITLSDLVTWAYQQDDPIPKLIKIQNLALDLEILPFDDACALELGQLRGRLLRKGISISSIDFMLGCTALVHDLTMVTHNVADFRNIPDLRIEDWLAN